MRPEVWLFFPDPVQKPVADPVALLGRLLDAGVELLVLPDGALAAVGPSGWFTDTNRLELRQRFYALRTGLAGRTSSLQLRPSQEPTDSPHTARPVEQWKGGRS